MSIIPGQRGRPFQKGVCPNPGGRPKAIIKLAEKIRELTNDGEALAEFAVSVWRGEVEGMQEANVRMEAFKWLADRGFGKAPQIIDVNTDGPTIDPVKIALVEALQHSPHQRRERMDELIAKAGGKRESVQVIKVDADEPG